ncbi:MAG: sulfurtransferase TusA family protein [Pseudomonadota bacterium]|nr:sulfurtransferase TusA family protein [Pseudomonadota bacterium]
MELDYVGLVCPMPILKLKKHLAQNNGHVVDIELVLSDKGGLRDIPAFCQQAGLSCTLLEESASEIRFKIKSC